MKDWVANFIKLDKHLVWVFDNQKNFHYSDGRLSEWYLNNILSKAKDLSSDSAELESYILDWPSEYHLSRKRANLLKGFEFDRSKKILEVGCGCGAITRFLGETFDEVIAVEGSIARSRLARMRTKGMNNVSILCAPFQEIQFTKKFDIIFCIGVFEYSGSFVSESIDPYNTILEYFHDVLTPDGVVVIAIENQFGLKYFASASEEHTGIRFDGLEGYPRGNKVKTFGYDELKSRLSQYFADIDFYFPYPDYKIPSCILSETFFSKAPAGELIGHLISRDYRGKQPPLFDEQLVLAELDKNNKLPFFANSFLVTAGKKAKTSLKFLSAGLMFTRSSRIKNLETISLFSEYGGIWIHKMPLNGQKQITIGKLRLCSYTERWVKGETLQFHLKRCMKNSSITIEQLFAPCRIWLKTLTSEAFKKNNEMVLNGKYIDCIWSNSYIVDDKCVFIDQEWKWEDNIHLNMLIIRTIYLFLDDIKHEKELPLFLKNNSLCRLIKEIAQSIGVKLTKRDFNTFIIIQSEMNSIILNSNIRIKKINLNILLWNRMAYRILSKIFSSSRIILKWLELLLHYALTTVRRI